MRRVEMKYPHGIVRLFLLIACISLPVHVWAQTEGRPCTSKPVNMSTFYGDMISCSIQDGSPDQYRFSGQAGEAIHIYYDTSQGTSTVTLLDPDGIIIASESGGLNSTISRELTKTGEYAIKFTYLTFGGPGYTFCLERVSPPSPSMPTLSFGQTFEKEISPIGDADYYAFAGYAGDTITASASVLTGNSVYFEAYDPDGIPILSGDSYGAESVSLLHSGIYTIRFRCGWLGSGSYRASLQCAGVCQESNTMLLHDGRFTVQVNWVSPDSDGEGTPIPLTSDSGYFWFFENTNVELLVKIKDGCAVNDYFWFFWGAMTDVAYTITVTDTQTDAVRTYEGAQHVQKSGNDIHAFACP
jgi:hypothetical protein